MSATTSRGCSRHYDKLCLQGVVELMLAFQLTLDTLFETVSRHGRNATIIASQLPVSDWYDVLEKNATIADAILDRLAKTSHKIDLRGESYRK